MAVHRAQMLSSSLLGAAPGAPPRLIARSAWDTPDSRVGERPADHAPARARTRIWEFGDNLHCAIIGTCLSTAELRHIVAKVETGAATASDHDLHMRGVAMAGRREAGARLLQKALDRKHHAAIARFAKAMD